MKRIAITGASSGIGLAIAKRLTAEGHVVHVLALDTRERWQEVGKDLVNNTTYHSVDLMEFEAASAALQAAIEEMKGIDVLINNAGVMSFENAHDSTFESVRKHIAVNLEAPALLTAIALKAMLEQDSGGHIINISSVAGLKATPKLAVYGATKAGLLHYTRAVAAEYASKKIRANVICPGAVKTSLTTPIMFSLVKKGIPLGELQTPEEVAALVMWLLSEEARNVTGSVFSLDGGMNL